MNKAIETEVLIITPSMATGFLKNNENNRRVSKRQLERLILAMKNGEFEFNGDPIRFDTKGRLLDGQHRLMACVKTNIPFKAVCIYNLPTQSFQTIDQSAKSRNFSDILSIEGEKNCSTLARAVSIQTYFEDGDVAQTRNGNCSMKSLDLAFKRNQGLRDSVNFCLSSKKILSPSILAFIHYNTSKFDKQMADKFVKDIISGSDLKSKSPVYFLREKLLQNKSSILKLSQLSTIMLVAKAWNLEASGAKIEQLRLPKATDVFSLYGVTND